MHVRKIAAVSVALLFVFITGTVGYMSIEHWSLLDSLYMTVITIASVGFMEIHPLSSYGRIFTIFLILSGTGILVYGVSTLIAYIVEGELTDAIRRRKMQKKIDAMANHIIICGYGKTAQYIMEEFVKTGKNFIVIEKDTDKLKTLQEIGLPSIHGDATHNSVLLTAGIQRASGLISTLSSDAENLLVVFTAKRLNKTIRVISKAIEEESEQKIRMAGADSVVMPNFIGGLRMASELIRPSVVSFLDIMLRSKDKTIRIEELEINTGSPFIEKSLHETGLQKKSGVSVVALKNSESHDYKFNPSAETILKAGDIVILMGDVSAISDLKKTAMAY